MDRVQGITRGLFLKKDTAVRQDKTVSFNQTTWHANGRIRFIACGGF